MRMTKLFIILYLTSIACANIGYRPDDSGLAILGANSDPNYTPPVVYDPPIGVTASDSLYTDKVRITWVDIQDANGYKIYRNSTNNTGTASQIGTDTASPYDDTTATAGQTYYYWLKATYTGGISGFSSGDSGVRLLVEEPNQVYDPNWPYGIGIPTPLWSATWGTYEPTTVSYRIYDDPNKWNPYIVSATGGGYKVSDSGGYYTHYVDPVGEFGTATDSSNPYGSKTKPRKTLPTMPLPKGSIVEIHSGTFSHNSGSVFITTYATADMPTFIRGLGNHHFAKKIRAEGTYMILEGLDAVGCNVNSEYNSPYRDSSNICVRNCDIHIAAGDTYAEINGCSISGSESNSAYSTDVVYYNNTIHDRGDVNNLTKDSDYTGIMVGTNTTRLWILDNTIYNLGGSGMQIGGLAARYIYIGGNEVYNTLQAGIALKYGEDIIISQNTCHDIVEAPWSPSKGFGMQYLPKRVWLLFNTSYNNHYGIRMASITGTGYDNINFIGNLIDNCYLYGIYAHNNEDESVEIMYNTIHNCSWGLSGGYYAVDCNIYNNIISDFNNAVGSIGISDDKVSLTDGDTFTIEGRVYEFDDDGSYTGDVQVDINGASAGIEQLLAIIDAINNDISASVVAKGTYGYRTYVLNKTTGVSGIGLAMSESAANFTVSATLNGGIMDFADSDHISRFDNNLVYGFDGTGSIIWNATYTNLAGLIAGSTLHNNCVESDPLFTDPNNFDFSLPAESPFRSIATASAVDDVIANFLALYGIDIESEVKELTTNGTQNAPNIN
jgi:hypothetical protein